MAQDGSLLAANAWGADILTECGYPVARRTVVKYREELRIPASYLRRR